MEITKEQKIQITTKHDRFVREYNEFLDEIAKLMVAENKSIEQALRLSELRIHANVIKQNLEAMAGILDVLGFWYREYKVNPDITKEAANRPIILS